MLILYKARSSGKRSTYLLPKNNAMKNISSNYAVNIMLVEFLQLFTNNIFLVPEDPPALCEIIIAPKGLSLGFEYFIVTTFYLLH